MKINQKSIFSRFLFKRTFKLILFNRTYYHTYRQMVVKILLVLLGHILWKVSGALLTSADFLYQVSYTNSYFWNNYVGIVLNLDEVVNDLNKTQFQGYILNSNIRGVWPNNFATTIRMPKGWYYDCAAAGVDPNDATACKFQISSNTTFLGHLG